MQEREKQSWSMRAREERLQLGQSSSCCRVPVSNVPATRHQSPSRAKGNIVVITNWSINRLRRHHSLQTLEGISKI